MNNPHPFYNKEVNKVKWAEYYMNIAKEVAKKSKDPSSKVGCVIVDIDNRPVSFGFNGFISKCDEQMMTVDRPLKYLLTVHAEMNALILSKENNLEGCTVYTTHGPCSNCLKHLLQAKVRTIIYNDPGIIQKRGSEDEKNAITRLILSTEATVVNINNHKDYYKEINEGN